MNSTDGKNIIERVVKGNEAVLIKKYIKEGPTALKRSLRLADKEKDWSKVFDYLIFEKNMLYKCVATNADFFIEKYVKFGPKHVRSVLDIEKSKYDSVWGFLFEYIAIVNEGLYYHVIENRDKYVMALKARGSDYVRRILGIAEKKYDKNWEKILDFLLHSFCDALFSERNFENSLKAFDMIMNGLRKHRRIDGTGLLPGSILIN